MIDVYQRNFIVLLILLNWHSYQMVCILIVIVVNMFNCYFNLHIMAVCYYYYQNQMMVANYRMCGIGLIISHYIIGFKIMVVVDS